MLESRDANVLLPDLLPFICQTDAFFEHAVGTSAGSLSPRTNWTSLADFEFAFPPIDEQQRMVETLTALEEESSALQALSIATDRLRRSIMIEHFDADYASRISISNIGTWHSGGTPARSNASYWGGAIPWVSPKDMKVTELDTTEEKVTLEGVNAGSKLMPNDTIMIVVRGMILAHTFPVARTLVPAAFNQDMKALVVSSDFRPKYIQYWFEHSAKRYLQLVSESSHGTKRLESEKLFSLSVPSISLAEQDVFIAQIDDFRNLLKKAAQRRHEMMGIKRVFMNEQLVIR